MILEFDQNIQLIYFSTITMCVADGNKCQATSNLCIVRQNCFKCNKVRFCFVAVPVSNIGKVSNSPLLGEKNFEKSKTVAKITLSILE